MTGNDGTDRLGHPPYNSTMIDAWSTFCSLGVVVPALVGLCAGFISDIGLFTESVRLGATVEYARFYADHPTREISPGLPRGIFFAELFAIYGLFKGWCSAAFIEHQFFVFALFVGAISSASWLLLNYQHQSSIDAERQARIDQFISDPKAEVPLPVIDNGTQWFHTWNIVNIAFFAAFMAPPVIALLPWLRASVNNLAHP